MKKINKIIVLIFVLTIINFSTANANPSTGILVAIGATQTQAPSNGPTTGGVTGGSYGVVDSKGEVTNIVVCHWYCSNGTFGQGGDLAALQIPNSNVGVWFGPGTATYDKETKVFTVTDPVSREITNTDGDSSASVFGNRTLTFTSGNIFERNGELVGAIEGWTLNSTANISVTKDNVSESLFLGTKKTSQETEEFVNNSNLLLLNSKVQKLISLLGSWIR